MCFYNDDGYPEFYRYTSPKARKTYRCDECERMILPGDEYMNHTGKFDGDLFVLRVCMPCEYVRDLIYRHEIREGCAPHEAHCPIGGLKDYVEESLGGVLLVFGEELND